MKNPVWTYTILVVGTLCLLGCGPQTPASDDDDDDDDDSQTEGIEAQPPALLDFGTIYECTQHSQDLLIINHGPDDEYITIDVDSLVMNGFVVNGFLPSMTLSAGDEFSMSIGLSPGLGGAGPRDGSIIITTQDHVIEIAVTAEVVAGDECG
jgi:hypothetical protein